MASLLRCERGRAEEDRRMGPGESLALLLLRPLRYLAVTRREGGEGGKRREKGRGGGREGEKEREDTTQSSNKCLK